jgi:hypothetical protein
VKSIPGTLQTACWCSGRIAVSSGNAVLCILRGILTLLSNYLLIAFILHFKAIFSHFLQSDIYFIIFQPK